jgi:Major Facilitator Superfamily
MEKFTPKDGLDLDQQSPERYEDIALKDSELAFRSALLDPKRNHQLNRRLDLRVLPLCCWVYLLNFLDRGNIGNSKVLNQETGDDLLQQAKMTANGYALTVTLFSLAYTLFEVPSNWVMKHYVRPSLWLGFLLFCWGALTIGFAGVHNYATVVVLRFLIGVFEAGFFPGKSCEGRHT